MARWEPGTRERLQAAALDLYIEQGFERTTVAEIARRVGVTERTFFRHFADKPEVLFDGAETLREAFVDGIAAGSPGAAPMQLTASALDRAASFFTAERRAWSRRRQTVISANPRLQERELLKMAALAQAVAAALRHRGVAEPAATLAAETGITVFGVAFAQWIADGEQRSFTEVEQEVLGLLGAVLAGSGESLPL